jgi:hypothetical protein
MATEVISSIGSTGDYSTPALWEDGTDNTSLVTADEIRIGELQNQEFTSAGEIFGITGATTDSTRYRVVRCATGASFRDHANKLTNALRYNASNGAGLRMTSGFATFIHLNEDYCRLQGLQISAIAGSGSVAIQNSVGGTRTGIQIDDCIVEGRTTASGGMVVGIVPSGVIRNSLFVQHASGAQSIASWGSTNYTCVNCTFVAPSDLATAPTHAIAGATNTGAFKNCAFFGVTNTADGSSTFTTCYSDDASPPTGCTTATYADQFENTTTASRDFRVKSGADLIDTGTTDATNAASDIVGTARPSGSSYDVGAWEFAQDIQLSGSSSTGGQGSYALGTAVPL